MEWPLEALHYLVWLRKMPRFAYTPAMIKWAKQHVPGKRYKAARLLFNEEFGLNKGKVAFSSFLKKNKITNGLPTGSLPGETNVIYTPEIIDWLREQYTQKPVSAFLDEFNERFGMSVNNKTLHSALKRHGVKSGRIGQFKKNQPAWNKGMKMPFNPKAARTQFKKGGLPHNTKYEGYERSTKEGYIEISIAETNPHTGFERRFVLKHRFEWEKVNGPIPKGMALKCMDGDKSNCDPSNWEVVDRGLLPKLTRKRKFEQLPNELKPTVLAVTRLEHQIEKIL